VDPGCGDRLPSAFRANQAVDQQLSFRQPARGEGSNSQWFCKIEKRKVPQEQLSIQILLVLFLRRSKSVLTVVD